MRPWISAVILLLASALPAVTQQSSDATVPTMVNFSGTVRDVNGKPLTGLVGVTFYLYKDQQGGAPLWMETQNVQLDKAGHYSVMLGSTTNQGLSPDLFASGTARWLGVQAQGQEEQPRVMLLSVPYAMKALDAQTIGGLPPSAFVLAAPPSANALTTPNGSDTTSASPATSSDVTTTGGTVSTIPLFTTSTNVQNSILRQTASTAINVLGKLNLPALGTATATAGFKSRPQDFVASVFDSSTAAAVAQTFQWQAEPLNNDKSTATGTLNLLYAAGTATPAETGLKISGKGLITFASGQTFPGAGRGTITEVTAGTGLSGGGTSGNVTLNNTGVLGVPAGRGITSSGGQTPTIAINPSVVPELGAANTFTGNQKVNGSLTANVTSGTSVTGTSGSGTGVAGSSTSAVGVSGASSTNVGVYGTSGSYVGVFGQSTSDIGLYGTSSSGQGVEGVSGTSNGVYGVGGNIGVYGATTSTFVDSGWGVEGQSSTNVGVYGSSAGMSNEGASFGADAGVWGDTGSTNGALGYSGVVGTADNNQGGAFYNNGASYAALAAANFVTTDSSAIVFSAGLANFCFTDVSGNLFCTGSKSAVVPVDGGSRHVALYAVEAPDNWFEDAGTAQLARGEAVVNLDPLFSQTVNGETDYHVFLTPRGDCKGLYIAQQSPSLFVVRELGGGVSNTKFDYRIMAKRRGYENVRLADKTKQVRDQGTRAKRMLEKAPAVLRPATANATKQPGAAIQPH